MSSISFGNLTTNNQQLSPELQKRIESQENFTAIDKEKLKQDTVELTAKAQEKVKDNFIFRILRNLGVEDPKKFLISVGLTFATIVGFAFLGNKSSNFTAKLGTMVDEWLKKPKMKWVSDIGGKISGFFGGIGKKVKNAFPLIDEISQKVKAKAIKPKNPMAKAQCSGIVYQFACAVIESIQGIFYGSQKKLAKDSIGLLKHTVNGKAHKFDFKKVFEFVKEIAASGKTKEELIDLAKLSVEDLKVKVEAEEITEGLAKFVKSIDFDDDGQKFIDSVLDLAKNQKESLFKLMEKANKADIADIYKEAVLDSADDRVEFARKLTENIRKSLPEDQRSNKGLLAFFNKVQKGNVGPEFKDINMVHGMDSWCTTNWIDNLGQKLFKDKWKNVSKANLGSALIKFNAVNGDLAESGLGKFVQAAPTIVTESISNYVCDKAWINAMVIPSFIGLYNNVQEAPKEQKAATLASSFVSDVGSLTVVMPTAGAITYGIANLSKLQGNGILKTPLRWIGNLFAMGLKHGAKPSSKLFGGIFRLIMIMFVFTGMISKPIEKLVQKIFGKPYNKEEAEKERQLEEQKKQIVPELGITQGELMEKIEKNPAAMQKLQTDPKLLKALEREPKILLDLLDNKEVDADAVLKATSLTGGKILSPANSKYLNNSTNMVSNNSTSKAPAPSVVQEQKTAAQVDTVTYVPSSEYIAKSSDLTPEQQSQYHAMMAKSDEVLKMAEKYI